MSPDDVAVVHSFLVSRLSVVFNHMLEVKSATEMYPPLSFVQIMRLLVDVYMMLMPVLLVNQMYIASDPTLAIQFVPVLACFLVTLFYNGLMHLVLIIRKVRVGLSMVAEWACIGEACQHRL